MRSEEEIRELLREKPFMAKTLLEEVLAGYDLVEKPPEPETADKICTSVEFIFERYQEDRDAEQAHSDADRLLERALRAVAEQTEPVGNSPSWEHMEGIHNLVVEALKVTEHDFPWHAL